MWILTIYSTSSATSTDDILDPKNGPQEEKQIYRLVGASEYTLGRKGCMITLPTDDPSISRHHATIIVSSTPAIQLNSPTTFFPKVHIIDFSKHGTIINGVSVPPLTKKDSAKSGSTIIFGRSVVGILNFAPVICYISRTVYPHIADQLKVQIAQLCGFATDATGENSSAENDSMIAPCWTQQELREAGVSPSCLLYIAEGIAPEKGLMSALLERYCLVSPTYIPALMRAIKDTPAIPLASIPPPSSAEAPRDEALERLPYRRPEPQIFDGGEFSRSAPVNPGATFRTFHLIFVEADVYSLYHEAIRRGGGNATLVTPYDVLSWYQKNSSSILQASINNQTGHHHYNNNNTSGSGTIDPLLPPADNAFPLRYLLQDRDTHGTNTFVVCSPRAFVGTLELIQSGIEEGLVTTKKANRTIVQLPTPTGTIADALALLYLKARIPLVRDHNVLYALYAEDAATFVAGHAPDRSPTNQNVLEAERLHFEFADPSLAASALQVELEEASVSGHLHAPKRNTNYLHSSASRERERNEKINRRSGRSTGHSTPSLLMKSNLDNNNNNNSHLNDVGADGNSPASSISTVDNIRAYVPPSNNNNNNSSLTPTKSILQNNDALFPTRSPRTVGFGNDAHNASGGLVDDGLNDDNPGMNRYASAGSFSRRQEIVCCKPERIFSKQTLTPRRDRDLILRKQQEDQQRYEALNNVDNSTRTSTDALYAKWQSFYDSAREGDLTRAQIMYENKQLNSGSVGRRRAASPGWSSNNNNNINGGGGIISVGQQNSSAYSPSAAIRATNSHRPIGTPKSNVPFAVSQSSLIRGGSPFVTHKRNVMGDVNVPHSAPFASRALVGNSSFASPSSSSTVGGARGNSPMSASTPRLLMQISATNVDHRLLQYCQELEMNNLQEVETEVLHANSQHSQGLVYGNLDLLKQRVMRYLVDIDMLMSESKRLTGQGRRAASPSVMSNNNNANGRAPLPIVGRGTSPASRNNHQQQPARSGSANRRTNSPSRLGSMPASPVMTVTTNEAFKLALDCKSRLSVLLTVLEGPEFQSKHQHSAVNRSQQLQLKQQQQQQSAMSGRRSPSNVNNQHQFSSSQGYYNFDNIERDQDRRQLQKIEDALHSPQGSTRIAEERASSQRTAQRILNDPRSTNTPSIPYNTSLLPKKNLNKILNQ